MDFGVSDRVWVRVQVCFRRDLRLRVSFGSVPDVQEQLRGCVL